MGFYGAAGYRRILFPANQSLGHRFQTISSLRSMAVLSSRAQERRSHEKFAREARENERRSREKNKNRRFFKLLPPQSPRGFSALARLCYLVRPTKTAMLRRLDDIILRRALQCAPLFDRSPSRCSHRLFELNFHHFPPPPLPPACELFA